MWQRCLSTHQTCLALSVKKRIVTKIPSCRHPPKPPNPSLPQSLVVVDAITIFIRPFAWLTRLTHTETDEGKHTHPHEVVEVTYLGPYVGYVWVCVCVMFNPSWKTPKLLGGAVAFANFKPVAAAYTHSVRHTECTRTLTKKNKPSERYYRWWR